MISVVVVKIPYVGNKTSKYSLKFHFSLPSGISGSITLAHGDLEDSCKKWINDNQTDKQNTPHLSQVITTPELCLLPLGLNLLQETTLYK